MSQMTRIPIARGGRRPYIHRTDEINGGCILHCVSVSLPTFVAYVRNVHSLFRNQEVKLCLLELKPRPLKLKPGPLELKLGPLELKLRLLELNPRPLELNPCPLEFKPGAWVIYARVAAIWDCFFHGAQKLKQMLNLNACSTNIAGV